MQQLKCINRIIIILRLNSNGQNNIVNSEINVEMGNQASGPKRRPEISAGTLTRPKGPSSTGGLRLPIPNDDELEKRYKIFWYFRIKSIKVGSCPDAGLTQDSAPASLFAQNSPQNFSISKPQESKME